MFDMLWKVQISLPSDTCFLPAVVKLHKKYGNTFLAWFGFTPRLFTSDHKILEYLLSSTVNIDKSYEYFFSKNWIAMGLLLNSGEKWKKMRKLLTPAFHLQNIEQFLDIIDAQSGILVEKLKNKVGEPSFDIFPYMKLCTLDIICEAAMRTSVNAQNNPDSAYVKSVSGMCRIAATRAFSAVKQWDLAYSLSKDFGLEQKYLKVLHSYTISVIKSRRNELINKVQIVHDKDCGVGVRRKSAFLDILLRGRVDGKPLPDKIIKDEVDTFMFEGHDTVTSGISFALYCLGKNSEIQKKVFEEQRGIFYDNMNRSLTIKDIRNMGYLDMVIKESMRIYPPVPYFARDLNEDLYVDGVLYPKNLAVSVVVHNLHRKEDVFPNPDVFDPERFSTENYSKRLPFTYLPFSAGPRNCIGQKFAMMEMTAVLSKIIRHFEILDVPEHTPILSTEIILTSANGVLLRLKERTI